MRRRDLLAAVAATIIATRAAEAASVYDSLGGEPGLVRIVDALFGVSLFDDRIRAKFDNINVERLKGRLVQHLCQVTGGPCEFHGISMKGAHRGLDLTDADFNALVEDTQIAMDRCGISYWTQNRLLALLAPMRRDVVTQ